jgi:16S rRNA A1518/A1519 N6-dimethyltransferase RsmA/KsgA/DIM1 with predicted DNA glycosylase/AP lyase activity
MLGNSLQSLLSREAAESALAACGIDRSRRAETLTIEEFGLLANEVARSHKAELTPDISRGID